MKQYYTNFIIRRSDAIALLVRLEIGDISYPHSKKCRMCLIEYLTNALMKEENVQEDLYVEICPDEINLQGDDLKTAIQIIKNYTEAIGINY